MEALSVLSLSAPGDFSVSQLPSVGRRELSAVLDSPPRPQSAPSREICAHHHLSSPLTSSFPYLARVSGGSLPCPSRSRPPRRDSSLLWVLALCISFSLQHYRALPRDVRIPQSDMLLEGRYLCLSAGAMLFSEALCVLENILNTE